MMSDDHSASRRVDVLEREAPQLLAPESVSKPSVLPGRHDASSRRRVQRQGRERGCWVYIPAEELLAAGFDPRDDAPLYYRTWGYRRGSVLVRVYKTGA